jgi:hypothetical protein
MKQAFNFAVTLCACAFVSPAAFADIVETFDNGSDNGDWHLTSNTGRFLNIEPTGGNPGPYLHGNVESATPTWYIPQGTQTDFLGDFVEKSVVSMGADINIFEGNQEPNRTLTLDLRTSLGTGDFFMNGVEAYYIGPDISNNTPGWISYNFPLDARSQLIPPGWTVYKGSGLPGTFLDWQNLMHDVETLGFILGQPGFAYTNHTVWDLARIFHIRSAGLRLVGAYGSERSRAAPSGRISSSVFRSNSRSYKLDRS